MVSVQHRRARREQPVYAADRCIVMLSFKQVRSHFANSTRNTAAVVSTVQQYPAFQYLAMKSGKMHLQKSPSTSNTRVDGFDQSMTVFHCF